MNVPLANLLKILGLRRATTPSPDQAWVTDTVFGNMRWSVEDRGWHCRPSLTYRGTQYTVDLIIYVEESTTRVSQAQYSCWINIARSSETLIAWAIRNACYEKGRHKYGHLVKRAKPVAGLMHADSQLDLEIDVGDDIGGHAVQLSVGPGVQQSATLMG